MSQEPEIKRGHNPKYPPGPAFLPRLFSGQAFRQNTTGFMQECAANYGDLVHYSLVGRHVYQLNHPALIENYFLRDASKHHRGLVMQRAKVILGDGLLTSEEPIHMRQRRLAQPAFHRQRIAAYGEIIGTVTASVTAAWQPGETTNLYHEMLQLALRIVGKCLFDLDVMSREEVLTISRAVDAFQGFLPLALLPFSKVITRLPIPPMQKILRGKQELDSRIDAMIAIRRAAPGDRGDLLSMLLESVDPEDDRVSMSDQQVHDECLTILLAGHETTANALSFSLWLLALHPEVQTKLHQEAIAVLAERSATAADYARLPYAVAVFSEALRLYPPVWVTARTCAEPYEIAGYPIASGAILLAPQYVVHRDARFFPDPAKFDPGRWTEAGKSSRPRYSFFPFAGGSRQCIGEGLAWMEGVLCLAIIARDWRVTPGTSARKQIVANPAVSLRPKGGLALRLERA